MSTVPVGGIQAWAVAAAAAAALLVGGGCSAPAPPASTPPATAQEAASPAAPPATPPAAPASPPVTPARVPAPPAAPSGDPAGPVTFTRDIAPIVFTHCAPCHRPGGSGPFSLLTWADTARRARQIAEVTASRFMPPWLPEPGYGTFVGERRLAEGDIARLARWADAGAPEGDPADLPPAPAFADDWALGTPDLVVTLPTPYTLPADGPDVFRNLVLPVPVDDTRWVRTVELRPGNPQFVHHAIMAVDDTSSSRRREADETDQPDQPGFSGMEMGLAFMPDGHLTGWTPGMAPHPGLDGLAWRLTPGADVVLQLHMLPSGRPETIAPRVGLHFADAAPDGPPLALIRLDADHRIDIPPGAARFVVEDAVTLPVDVEVHAVYPHAHYVATAVDGRATLPDGTERWLIRIDDWDFNWQDVYRVQDPYVLPRGTTLSMRVTFDNSDANPRNPSRPPRRVRAGNRSTDEMAHLQLQVRLRRAADQLPLRNALARRAIARNPANPWAHYELGTVLEAQDRLDEAAQRYRDGLAADPTHLPSQNSLGAIHERQGRLDAAEAAFEAVIRLDPAFADGHYNLGSVLLALGRTEAAMARFRDALAIAPDHAAAHANLGYALRAAGRLDDAIAHYRDALRLQPASADAHNNLGSALAVAGRLEEAITRFREALALQPDHAGARSNLDLALEIAAEAARSGGR